MAVPKTTDPLPMRLVKHPLIWGGVGMLIRYGDDHSMSGNFWKVAGVASLVWGVGSTFMTQEHDPYRLKADR